MKFAEALLKVTFSAWGRSAHGSLLPMTGVIDWSETWSFYKQCGAKIVACNVTTV